jgi:hypothetical protein
MMGDHVLGVAGGEQHHELGLAPAQECRHLAARDSWENDVRDEYVRGRGLGRLDAGFAGRHAGYLVTCELEDLRR